MLMEVLKGDRSLGFVIRGDEEALGDGLDGYHVREWCQWDDEGLVISNTMLRDMQVAVQLAKHEEEE